MKRYISRTVFLILFFSTLLTAFFSESSLCYAQNYERVVRVGFFPMEGYNEALPDGSYTGMDVEYLNNIRTYTNWTIEYVKCDSWDAALEKLEAKEIDLVGSAQYSPQRAEIFEYASLPSGHTFGVIAVSANSPYAYEDFEAIKDVHFGVVSTYVRKQEFISYLQKNGIVNPNITEYVSTEELKKAFASGEIEAYVHTFTEIETGQRIVGRFAPRTFYYISYKGNDELLGELNQAIADLKINQPNLENELLNKYYEDKVDKTVVYSIAEKEFLDNKKKLTVGYIGYHYPISYVENGEFTGLAKEYVEEIALLLGVETEYVFFEDEYSAFEKIEKGEIDLMCFCTGSEATLKKYHLTTNGEYVKIPAAIISSQYDSDNEVTSIAVTKELESAARNIYDNPDITIRVYNSEEECLEALAHKKNSIAICDAYLTEYLLDMNGAYYNLKLQSVANMDYGISAVYSESADKEFVSLLKKVSGNISDKAVSEYMVEHNARRNVNLKYFINRYKELIMGIVILIFVVIILVLMHIYNDSKKIQQLMYKDFNMDVWNLNYLTYNANENLRINGKNHYAIVYINISQFRKINSLYGWRRGQELLELIVSVLNEELLGTSDIFARDQGDRFVLFVKYDYQSNLAKRIEDLKTLIEEQIQNEFSLHMTLVIGICTVPNDEKYIQKIISNANVAMDEARAFAGEKIVFYDESLENDIKEEHDKEQLLSSVDFDNDFIPYYQAKVDIRTKKIIGAEALARFIDHSDGDAIKAPGFFVPYFESNGKIKIIDFKVLEAVCKMLNRRMAAGKEVVTVSCNFSRYHFLSKKFADKFEEVLNRYNIPKELIEVEVTETVVMDDMQRSIVKATLDDLYRRNIRISIDDFGSGYSSLGIFEQIPASVIKLDRSFLLNHENKERQIAIMSGVVQLAEKVNAEVVCEGVETDSDVELMREIGAYIAQGYKFSKPVSEEAFELKLDMQ